MEQTPIKILKQINPNLKVLATIAKPENPKIIEWGIFFNPADNDSDWGTNISLFLIPLTTEANGYMGNKEITKEYKSIVLRNSKNEPKNKKNGYKQWYDDEPSWENDTIVNCKFSISKGKIKSVIGDNWGQEVVSIDGKTYTWNIWSIISNTDTNHPNTVGIVFDIEPSLINENITTRSIKLLFGLSYQIISRKKRNWLPISTKYPIVFPFFGIEDLSLVRYQTKYDWEIIWYDWFRNGSKEYNFRSEDVLAVKNNSVIVDSWDNNDFLKVNDPKRWTETNYKTYNDIVGNFKTDNADSKFALILEKNNYRDELNLCYFREFGISVNDSILFYELKELTDDQKKTISVIKIIQVCRKDGSSIYLRAGLLNGTGNPNIFQHIWNRKADATSKGLKSVADSNPVGLVPKLSDASFSFVREWKYISKNNDFLPEKSAIHTELEEHRLDITLQRIKDHVDFKANELKLTNAKIEVYSSESDNSDKGNNECASANEFIKDNGTFFEFIISEFNIDREYELIDGSLGLRIKNGNLNSIKPGLDKKKKYGRFRLTLQSEKSQKPFYWWQWRKDLDDNIVVSYAIEDFLLPVSEVNAAGQDRLSGDRFLAPQTLGTVVEGAGERTEPSLIIPLTPKNLDTNAGGNAPYFLSISESVNVGQDHRINMKLVEFNPMAGEDKSSSIRAVILDPNPQFIGLVQANFLQQPDFDDGAWVLAVREEEGGWRFLVDHAASEGFQLVLPSQAIGEAYVKNNKKNDGSIEGGEPQKGLPIDYRFGAPAILRLAPERLDKRYVTAPWNLRRIWSQPGEVSPGIPLLEAQFELLYGLQGHLKPEKAFLAELASKLGEVPVPPVNKVAWNPTKEQRNTFEKEWREYFNFYRAWKSRLAILEPSVNDNFSNAKFDENLSYRPRIELNINKTTNEYIKKGARLRLPIPATSLNDNNELDRKIKAAHEDNGLAGGFHYGFESPAIYKEFWRESLEKGSSSAVLENPAFSSLGGYGKQIARFAGDKTVIKSISTLGRTHFYAVERIGRIGVFWHKAKHVIEYERTVVPTEQFKDQPPHLGRPLLRKVREYIEILEPTRKYPDFSTSQPDAPGAVMGCTFKNIIIPVLSSWGHDVIQGKKDDGSWNLIGWEVPLWKPGADPKVYAKPQIQLELTPPPDSDQKSILVNLSEPENLWFYTDTREKVEEIIIDANVHKWPPVKYVDYTDLPEPEQYDIAPAAGDSPELLEAIMPDVLDVLPGFERYTFKVDRNEIPAAVASRYYPKSGITGRMRSVSMMREFARNENWTNIASDLKTIWDDFKSENIQDKLNKAIVRLRDDNTLQKEVKTLLKETTKNIIDAFQINLVNPKESQRLFKLSLESLIKAKDLLVKINSTDTDINAAKTYLNLKAKLIFKVTALDSLLAGKNSLLAKYANGFTDLENEIRIRKIPSIDKYEKEIKNFIEKNKINERLQAINSIDTQNTLVHFKDLWNHQNQLTQIPTKWLWRESLEAADGIVNRTLKFYDQESQKLIKELRSLQNQPIQLSQEAFDKFRGQMQAFHVAAEFSIDGAYTAVLKGIDTPIYQLDKSVSQLFDELKQIVDGLNLSNVAEKREELNNRVELIITSIKSTIGKLKNLSANNEWKNTFNKIEEQLIDAKNKIKTVSNAIEGNLESIAKGKRAVYEFSNKYQTEIQNKINNIRSSAHLLVGNKKDVFININENLKGLGEAVLNKINEYKGQLTAPQKQLEEIVADCRGELITVLVSPIKGVLYEDLEYTIFAVLKIIDGFFKNLKAIAYSSLLEVFGANNLDIDAWLKTLDAYNRLESAIKDGKIPEILNDSRALANQVNEEFGRLAGEVAQKVKDFDRASNAGKEVAQVGKQTMNNFRSVWEEFTAPGMGLNRKTIALIVKTNPKDIQERLSITPCISRVKQLGHELEGLGLRMPVVSITDRLLPALPKGDFLKSAVGNFDFSNLLSDIGGMRLDKLFPGFKMPDIGRENIKITQGFDKQSLMAWINAEANIRIAGRKTLMSNGALQVSLEGGSFKAKTRIEANSEGSTKKNNKGELRGSWHIAIGGTSLMVFRDTGVIFDNGKFTFDLDPSRMQMPGLLKLLTDATQKLVPDFGGGKDEENKVFKIGLQKQNGIPTGLKAALDIPPTSIGGGPTGISNLSFGGFIMLSFLDDKFKPRFITGCGFYVGTRENPFNVSIFFLGGGGYIQYAMYFNPAEGITVRFAMSVHVSATFEVALGWMQGGLSIRLGLEGVYEKYPNRNSSVYISIFVEISGHVEIIRLISVQLYLMLQATYVSTGGGSHLVGTGRVRITIRISRFFKIKVEKSYSKTLHQTGGSRTESLAFVDDTIKPNTAEKAQAILNSLN